MKNISTLFITHDKTSVLDCMQGVIFTKQAYTRLSLSLLQGRKLARGQVGQPPTFLGQHAPHQPTGCQAISDHMYSMWYNLLIIINNENYSNKDICLHPTSPASNTEWGWFPSPCIWPSNQTAAWWQWSCQNNSCQCVISTKCSRTHWIGVASITLMVLKYTLYSWEYVSTIIWAIQPVPTLENSTAKNWVMYGSGAASLYLMAL